MDLQEELEKLNVHGLRDVARKINISSANLELNCQQLKNGLD